MKNLNKYKLNTYPSPIDKRDWKYGSRLSTTLAKLPETLDLRSDMFNIRDQGTQGSCAAMAGSAMKDWQEIKDIYITEYTSPQFIYNNRENSPGEGMYMRDLMKILKIKGVCFENSHPYGNKTVPSQKAYDEAKNHTVEAYFEVNSIIDLKSALNANGPCIIAVPVFNYTGRMWHQFPGQPLLGGHAMTVVGYDGKGFIIRNSWGTNWQDDGYTTFPYEDWGSQWEIWTSVDTESMPNSKPTPDPIPDPKGGCLRVAIFVGLILTSLGLLII